MTVGDSDLNSDVVSSLSPHPGYHSAAVIDRGKCEGGGVVMDHGRVVAAT